MGRPVEYDEEHCFRCCAEHGTSEPCPECDCLYYEFLLEDEEWWGEEEEL